MPLLIGIVGLFAPRLAIFLLWMFTHWFDGVFETKIWPILGFLFFPFTLLWYSAVMNWFDGVWEWWHILMLVFAVISDLGSDSKAKS